MQHLQIFPVTRQCPGAASERVVPRGYTRRIMWLMTTVGLFSVVRKTGDADLTVRVRARGDLKALREQYLPTLGTIETGGGTDYPFRSR